MELVGSWGRYNRVWDALELTPPPLPEREALRAPSKKRVADLDAGLSPKCPSKKKRTTKGLKRLSSAHSSASHSEWGYSNEGAGMEPDDSLVDPGPTRQEQPATGGAGEANHEMFSEAAPKEASPPVTIVYKRRRRVMEAIPPPKENVVTPPEGRKHRFWKLAFAGVYASGTNFWASDTGTLPTRLPCTPCMRVLHVMIRVRMYYCQQCRHSRTS
ncbi:hypothetical protein GUJ93_ZPchr0015g6898 [Zizania palustris]|uniref:Uncharacterized protein n=1 Tax=Zizania palustris TaxID=103762 RepID=A0A8J5W713_ZIZPA|nr:hypothetical protein GUJ93_ZPchr0015g6898 [Zizania palustris]